MAFCTIYYNKLLQQQPWFRFFVCPPLQKRKKVNKRNSSESHLPGCTFERNQCFFLNVRSVDASWKKQMMMFILFFQLEQHSQILFYVCNSLVENVYYNFFDKRKITFRPFFSKVQLGIRDFWNRGKQAAKLAYHASLLPWISLANEMTTRPLGKIRPAHSPFQMIKLWRTVYYEMKIKRVLNKKSICVYYLGTLRMKLSSTYSILRINIGL